MYCKNCGERANDNAVVCIHCGAAINSSGKSKVTAGVLGILLGGWGFHKFYMGKVGMGILYILFCWTLIPSIAGLIEGIIYLTESEESFARRLS